MMMINLQELICSIGTTLQQERSSSQMTLGEFIDTLKVLEPSLEVKTSEGTSLGKAISYRGYYCDLAFKPSDDLVPVGYMLNEAQQALGKEFYGYKGGGFIMTESTPLWVAAYSKLGSRIISVEQQGNIVMIKLEDENDD